MKDQLSRVLFKAFDNSVLQLGDSHIVEVLLRGRKSLSILTNTKILNATSDFLLEMKRPDKILF